MNELLFPFNAMQKKYRIQTTIQDLWLEKRMKITSECDEYFHFCTSWLSVVLKLFYDQITLLYNHSFS